MRLIGQHSSNQHDKGCVIEANAIVVSELSDSVSEEDIRTWFENPKRSGGGDIAGFTWGQGRKEVTLQFGDEEGTIEFLLT